MWYSVLQYASTLVDLLHLTSCNSRDREHVPVLVPMHTRVCTVVSILCHRFEAYGLYTTRD